MSPLDAQTAAFIQTGVSISVAAADAARLACMARGMGCRVGADGRVAVFVQRAQARELLDNVRRSARVACVFSLPSSNRTVQLKGADARVEPFAPADLAVVLRHRVEFTAEVVPLGTPAEVVRMLLDVTAADLATVSFTPCAAFSQTPGPRAGEALAASAGGAPA